jgi:Tol biopolymer transport system component
MSLARLHAAHLEVPSDGSGGLERLTTGPDWDYCDSLSPDGRFLLLARAPGAGDMDLLTVDLAGDRVARPFLATPMEETEAELSPDGRHVAYRDNHEGRFEIYVRPYPGPGAQVKVSNHGGLTPRWSPRGDEIFYRCADPETASPGICSAAIESGAGLAVGAPSRIIALPAGLAGAFTVAPDGQSFYMVRRESPEAATEGRLVYAPEWIDELARDIPVRRE